jgi:predicted nucleotidyltransferase
MGSSPYLIAVQSRLQDSFPSLSQKYPIERLALFGSITRGDFNPKNSDIDILVEFNGEIGWEFFDLCFELKNLFPDKKVDVVPVGAIQPHYWPFIEKDLVYVGT